jgi:hypothetical protein
MVGLELRISSQIFDNNLNGDYRVVGGPEEDDPGKRPKSKIS